MNTLQAAENLIKKIDELVGDETPEQLVERLKRREERKQLKK